MAAGLKTLIKNISIKHLGFILFLSFILLNFVISLENNKTTCLLGNYLQSAILIFFCISIIFCLWIIISLCFKNKDSASLWYSAVIISPVSLLGLWKVSLNEISLFIPIGIILMTQICLFIILREGGFAHKCNDTSTERIFIISAVILSFAIFSYIVIQKYLNFSSFNPKDTAIYNQMFYNTINGRLFENSAYGSNFAGHNTVFYFLLIPFYLIFPHPLTLLLSKILLLSLSLIPFYLIAKTILPGMSIIPLGITFITYPYLISQNFTAPHEIGYAPFFLLFTYYFFRLNKFWPFMIFLLLSLSIKEHISLLALMFGFYALFTKKSLKWILGPMVLGIAWAILSLKIIFYFQKLYHMSLQTAWFIASLKNRFLQQNGNLFTTMLSGLWSANISQLYSLRYIFLLLSPLGIILPLLSPISLLGLPEFAINLLGNAGNSAILSPIWHYNIVVSCFLLIATCGGIKRIYNFKYVKKLRISFNTFTASLSVIILSATLMQSYLWLGLTKYSKDTRYNTAVKRAIRLFPKEAFVSVPRNIAVHISARKDYSLVEEGPYGDYVLVDKNTLSFLSKKDIMKNYSCIFNENDILIFKRNTNTR
jgi:uncharacterized membrane protein